MALLLGVLLLFWLPIEDGNETWAALFACAGCLLAAAHFWNPAARRFRSLLIGSAAGLAVTPATLLLMALKTGLHGHAAPEYRADQITTVLLRTPVWIAAGLLIAIGITLYQKSRL